MHSFFQKVDAWQEETSVYSLLDGEALKIKVRGWVCATTVFLSCASSL